MNTTDDDVPEDNPAAETPAGDTAGSGIAGDRASPGVARVNDSQKHFDRELLLYRHCRSPWLVLAILLQSGC